VIREAENDFSGFYGATRSRGAKPVAGVARWEQLGQHSQPEVLLERLKVSIVVKQKEIPFDAKSCYPTIDRLSHGNAFTSEDAVICGASECILAAHHRINAKVREVTLERFMLAVCINALKDFSHYQIAQRSIASSNHCL
jgi:hypothetical protein